MKEEERRLAVIITGPKTRWHRVVAWLLRHAIRVLYGADLTDLLMGQYRLGLARGAEEGLIAGRAHAFSEMAKRAKQ